jgi:hypothetical protein
MIGRINKQKDGTGIGKHQRPKSTARPNCSSINKTKCTQCAQCDKTGHNIDDCWKKHPEKAPEWVKEKRMKKKKLWID